MTNQNTKIKHIDSTFRMMPYGERAGQPTISLKLSSSESNAIKVNSLESMFERYNWKRKVNSGFARLHIHGDNPLADRHLESLNYLFDLLDPRFVDIEIEASELTQEAPRVINNKADTYTVVFDENDDEITSDTEVLSGICERARSFGDSQFLFKASGTTFEDDVRQFSYDYGVYDSDIWLYPKGRKVHTVSDNYEQLETIAKRNTWNVSPRMDIVSSYEGSD